MAFGGDRDPLEQINAYIDLLLEGARKARCRGGCLMGNLAQELSDTHEGFRRRLARAFEAWRAFLEGRLRRAREQGRPDAQADPARLSRFLLAEIEGAILLAKVRKDATVLADCFDELKAHLGAWSRARQRRVHPGPPRRATNGADRRLKGQRP